MQRSTTDLSLHSFSARRLQNCTSSWNPNCVTNDVTTNPTVVMDESGLATVFWLILFAVGMCLAGLKLYCVDMPRDRNLAIEKERQRKDIIENVLIKKRVKRVGSEDLEKGLRGAVPSLRECRIKKADLLLPPPKDHLGDEEFACAICWEKYRENDEICYSHHPKCAHCFHFECIKPWLEKYDRCPICRRDYLRLPPKPDVHDNKSHHAVDTQSNPDEFDSNLRSRFTSALQEVIRREPIESYNRAREVQSDEREISGDCENPGDGMTNETHRSSNSTSFDTDLPEATEIPSLELEMEDCSLDETDRIVQQQTEVDRVMTV